MSRFNISIVLIKKDNSPGANFNINVEANDYMDAFDKGKSELAKVLEESGLVVKPTSTETTTPPTA